MENTADDVIKKLIQMNNVQKQKSMESLVSSLVDDIPVGVNLQSQKVLGTSVEPFSIPIMSIICCN